MSIWGVLGEKLDTLYEWCGEGGSFTFCGALRFSLMATDYFGWAFPF